MEYFWYTSEVIPEGLGFAHFSVFHIGWLAAGALLILLFCLLYRKMEGSGRSVWRKVIASLLIADELFKLIPMLITGRFEPSYLPFHLCSVNLFLIAWHACKPSRLLDNFLYTICIPGAVAALLFPSWTSLPMANYMVIHSFTVHILLVMYPVVLTAAGEIKPNIKLLPKLLLMLGVLACVALAVNLIFGTNFMFLTEAEPGNPLYLFEQMWGSHLLGFPVLITAVLAVMYAPWLIYGAVKKKIKV